MWEKVSAKLTDEGSRRAARCERRSRLQCECDPPSDLASQGHLLPQGEKGPNEHDLREVSEGVEMILARLERDSFKWTPVEAPVTL